MLENRRSLPNDGVGLWIAVLVVMVGAIVYGAMLHGQQIVQTAAASINTIH